MVAMVANMVAMVTTAMVAKVTSAATTAAAAAMVTSAATMVTSTATVVMVISVVTATVASSRHNWWCYASKPTQRSAAVVRRFLLRSGEPPHAAKATIGHRDEHRTRNATHKGIGQLLVDGKLGTQDRGIRVYIYTKSHQTTAIDELGLGHLGIRGKQATKDQLGNKCAPHF